MTKKPEFEDLESELPQKKKKNQSLMSKIWVKIVESMSQQTPLMKKIPLTFNVVLSGALILVYISIMIAIGTFHPIVFFFILPILYILARQIKLERKQLAIEIRTE